MTVELLDPAQSPVLLPSDPAGDPGGYSAPRSGRVLHRLAYPDGETLKILRMYADTAHKSKAYLSLDNFEKALLVALKSWHLGIDPIEAFMQIVYIKGRMTIQAQLMVALANRSGLLSTFKIPSGEDALKAEMATIICIRKDRPEDRYEGTFSKADAMKAGLWTKDGPWTTYPGQMMVWRAVSATLRRAIPEVLGGMYIPDELEHDDVPDTSKPKQGGVIISAPTQGALPPGKAEETVIEAKPWWDGADMAELVARAIKAKFIEENQGAADLLKILNKDDWTSFERASDAGKAIKASVDAMKQTPIPPVAASTEPPTAAAPAATPEQPSVDKTIHEVVISRATYNGKQIVFQTLKHGPVRVFSRTELAEMIGDAAYVARYKIKEWTGTESKPEAYPMEHPLILKYQMQDNGHFKVIEAKPDPDYIPF